MNIEDRLTHLGSAHLESVGIHQAMEEAFSCDIELITRDDIVRTVEPHSPEGVARLKELHDQGEALVGRTYDAVLHLLSGLCVDETDESDE